MGAARAVAAAGRVLHAVRGSERRSAWAAVALRAGLICRCHELMPPPPPAQRLPAQQLSGGQRTVLQVFYSGATAAATLLLSIPQMMKDMAQYVLDGAAEAGPGGV